MSPISNPPIPFAAAVVRRQVLAVLILALAGPIAWADDGEGAKARSVLPAVHADSSTVEGGRLANLGTGQRIALRFVTAAVSGTVGGFLGGSLLSGGCNGQGVCGEIGFLLGGSVGLGFGTAAGLRLLDPDSRFGLSLTSSWLGAALGIGLIGDHYETAWPLVLVCSSAMATFVSETSDAGRLPYIFMSRRSLPTRPFSFGVAPDPRGGLSASARLRF